MSIFSFKTRHVLQVFALVALAFTLSACASRPRPVEPYQPYTVVEVEVSADSAANAEFAARLKQQLMETAGRATRDVGQAVKLHAFIRESTNHTGSFVFFGSSRRDVLVELQLRDAASNMVIKTRQLSARATSNSDLGADSILLSRLVGDIRSALGLSGYAPYPVDGATRKLVRPAFRDELPDEEELLTQEKMRADPLLNGTVTPTTIVRDEPEAPARMDLSKPLLDKEPEPKRAKPSSPPPAAEPETGTGPQSDLGDDPCIITLENDCSDPDRN